MKAESGRRRGRTHHSLTQGKGKTAQKETKMSTDIQSRLRKSGATVVHWLAFALSLLTIGWVSFVPTGE